MEIEPKELADKINKAVAENRISLLYSLMVDTIRKKSFEIYGGYEKDSSDLLSEKFPTKEDFFDDIDKDIIFGKVQIHKKVILNSAESKKLTEQQVKNFINDLRRETWNYVYDKYVTKRKITA